MGLWPHGRPLWRQRPDPRAGAAGPPRRTRTGRSFPHARLRSRCCRLGLRRGDSRVAGVGPEIVGDWNERMTDEYKTNREAIAVVGIGCRLPGEVMSADDYWQLLLDGRDASGPAPV